MPLLKPSLAALLLALAASASAAPPKVLLIVSSEGRDAGKTRPGFEMDEYALAYQVLRANGLQIEVASPAGGAVVADKFNPAEDQIQALPPEAHELLQATRRTADLQAGEHAAVFIVGGKGAMFDLPRDPALAALLAAHLQQGGVLAAVCHGPAALAAVQIEGKPLVQGRRLTGFTDEEEAVFGKRWAKEYPFWLETRLREQGARWEEAALMMPKVVVDGRLVTGQNPFSTAQAAEELVRLLGRQPVARTPFKEEASMGLVTRWLGGAPGERQAVRAALQAEPQKYKADLIAMLGVFQFKSAPNDAARRQALAVMELAQPHFEHPQLRLTLAQAHAALGEPARARALLQALLAGKLDERERAAAQQALAALPSS
ncbi:type 1 glutamine amidotransferase domain-containing protein [Inhella proteolytica]|uniref:Type 1 glutamine amidotransferase domain-containing protein n=1 Tax=Inhella proteolytica TaxID=2795029 RepID=A0A931J3H4_9BURK|nr:type 1 glutamine amidotransferase domain-containing protein [Inhella proteolytica]MBH9576869.1 type 1 glutamine amidotransferase domain-containing protein [Inhella proteolytica]